MNDVIPPCGGYLPVYIEPNGYIVGIESEADVHLETRNINKWRGCFDSFSQAKSYVLDVSEMPAPDREMVAILELTSEGGGAALWTFPESVQAVTERRNIWRGCYGTWPVHPLSI
jgi:hypothetical protein